MFLKNKIKNTKLLNRGKLISFLDRKFRKILIEKVFSLFLFSILLF